MKNRLHKKIGKIEKIIGEINIRFIYFQTTNYLEPTTHFYQSWDESWRLLQVQYCKASLAQMLSYYGLHTQSVECSQQISRLNSKMNKLLGLFVQEHLKEKLTLQEKIIGLSQLYFQQKKVSNEKLCFLIHEWASETSSPAVLYEQIKVICKEVLESDSIPQTEKVSFILEKVNSVFGTDSNFYQNMTSFWNQISNKLTEIETTIDKQEKLEDHFIDYPSYLYQIRNYFLTETSKSANLTLENATFRFSFLFHKILSFCEKFIGSAPCEYAMIILGSGARKEMCPFSDFEFAIILPKESHTEKNYERIKKYFISLLQLIEIQFILIGETEPNPRGFCLDNGRNHPLAQPDLFLGCSETILSPFLKPNQITDVNLVGLLSSTELFCGTANAPNLYKEFLEIRRSSISSKIPKEPFIFGQRLALDLMLEAAEKVGRLLVSETNVEIKSMVIRVPSFFITSLYRFFFSLTKKNHFSTFFFFRYHNIDELETKSNSFEQLEDLFQKKIINQVEKKEFEHILNLSFSIRIALHLLHNCEQDENKHFQGKSLNISTKLIFSMDLILTKILDFIHSFWESLKILPTELSSIETLKKNRHLAIQKWIENKMKENFLLMKNLLSTGDFERAYKERRIISGLIKVIDYPHITDMSRHYIIVLNIICRPNFLEWQETLWKMTEPLKEGSIIFEWVCLPNIKIKRSLCEYIAKQIPQKGDFENFEVLDSLKSSKTVIPLYSLPTPTQQSTFSTSSPNLLNAELNTTKKPEEQTVDEKEEKEEDNEEKEEGNEEREDKHNTSFEFSNNDNKKTLKPIKKLLSCVLFYPDLPGIHIAVNEFDYLIGGKIIESSICKMSTPHDVFPLLLIQPIHGIPFRKYVTYLNKEREKLNLIANSPMRNPSSVNEESKIHSENDLPKRNESSKKEEKNDEISLSGELTEKTILIDGYYYSLRILLSLIIYPEDNLPNDIVLEKIKENGNYRMVCLYNNRAFGDPIVSRRISIFNSVKLQFKSAFFCLNKMTQPIDEKVVEFFKKVDVYQLLKKWLTILSLYDSMLASNNKEKFKVVPPKKSEMTHKRGVSLNISSKLFGSSTPILPQPEENTNNIDQPFIESLREEGSHGWSPEEKFLFSEVDILNFQETTNKIARGGTLSCNISLEPEMLQKMFSRFKNIQKIFLSQTTRSTHFELLYLTDPQLLKIYTISFTSSKDVLERYKSLPFGYEPQNEENDQEIAGFSVQSQRAFPSLSSSSSKNIYQSFLKKTCVDCLTLLKLLRELDYQRTNATKYVNSIEHGKIDVLDTIEVDLREKVVNSMDWYNIKNSLHPSLIQKISSFNLTNICLLNCLTLDNKKLKTIVEGSNPIKLNLNGCKNLKENSLSYIKTKTIEYLNISNTGISIIKSTSFLSNLMQFPSLKEMIINCCKDLKEVYIEAPNIAYFSGIDCRSLKKLVVSTNRKNCYCKLEGSIELEYQLLLESHLYLSLLLDTYKSKIGKSELYSISHQEIRNTGSRSYRAKYLHNIFQERLNHFQDHIEIFDFISLQSFLISIFSLLIGRPILIISNSNSEEKSQKVRDLLLHFIPGNIHLYKRLDLSEGIQIYFTFFYFFF